MTGRIAVYVVTYRRPELLQRALRSVVGQTFTNWVARVVNDDPHDGRVAHVIRELGDPRIHILEPQQKRGAAANFNLAFREKECPYASILEDDNWWEPTFLETMVDALRENTEAHVACGNERVHRQSIDGSWIDTGIVIWPERRDGWYSTPFETACGSAKLCNSAMVFRTAAAGQWQTPEDIPVDVTEHFRERLINQPIRLIGAPLVNYGETWTTNRATSGTLWAEYQCLLIGSCFRSLPLEHREEMARRLWRTAGTRLSPRATALLLAARAIPEARVLWRTASTMQRLRFWCTTARRPRQVAAVMSAPRRLGRHLTFLTNSSYNRRLASVQL